MVKDVNIKMKTVLKATFTIQDDFICQNQNKTKC